MRIKDQWPQQNRRARRQRARRGFADSDVWNMDAYLSIVIADMLDHLADIDHGHPMDFADDPDAWPAWLRETARYIRAYYDNEESDEFAYDDAIASLREGLARLGEQWGSLWD